MSIGASSLYIFKKIKEFNEKVNNVIDINLLYKKHKDYI